LSYILIQKSKFLSFFQSTPQDSGGSDVQTGTKSLAELYARCTALTMTSSIVKTVTGLLIHARDAVDERGLEVLNSAPIITKLMPNILASILSLAVVDPSSAVQVVTLIQEMLPSVACLNNLVLLKDSENGSVASEDDVELPVQHYAWVRNYESRKINFESKKHSFCFE